MESLEILSLILTSVIGLVVAGLYGQFIKFIKEQHNVNKANMLASRSMQRDVLFRYFRIVVEQGVSITPDEFNHIERCYTAYHENGGNGSGTLMWEKIKEHVKIDTGRN